MSLFDLSNQTAIVTGGASGIGLATVDALLDAGARVVIADRDEAAERECCRRLRNDRDADVLFVPTDVASPDDVARLIDTTLETSGAIHILMHFAGIGVERPAIETTLDEWNRIIAVNLTGSFLMLQAAGRVMVEAGYGRIVAMSSAAGIRGGSGRTAYGASKGGVVAMVRTMAVEWAPHGVTVNALAPGAIDTALVQAMHDAETRRSYLRGIPVDRYGTPEEVAASALFLALPAASYVTGAVFSVDGGFASSGVIKRTDIAHNPE